MDYGLVIVLVHRLEAEAFPAGASAQGGDMNFASSNLTAGQLNALVKKLGGETGVQKFLRGELALVESPKRDFPIWKTIKLGLHKSAEAYRAALESRKRRSGEWVNDFLGRPACHCAAQETEVDLALVSVGELGFRSSALYSEICEKAQALGLGLCSPEVGPALRLAYEDQPRGERLVVATAPFAASGDEVGLFSMEISGGGGLWLRGDCGPVDRFWELDRRFVFVRPRS
jgi:hypothetical protein